MALGNHLVEHLLQTADFLIEQAPRSNLGKAFRRRAISTAYYATFHAIAFIMTDTLVRWSRPNDVVEPVFRSLDHKVTRDRLLKSSIVELNRIGAIFAKLQDMRNDADYKPPAHNPGRQEALEALDRARDAITRIEALSTDIRLAFAVLIVSKNR